MASVTTWVRLEPRGRDPDLLAGTEARLHDPLWLLARQWQLGELSAVDAGSAITARTRVDVSRIVAVRGASGDWTSLDPDRTPLEAAMAPALDETSVRPALERRARTGRHLIRLLAGLPSAMGVFLSRFQITLDAADLDALDSDDRRFFSVVTQRVPDGDAAAEVLTPLLAAGDLTTEFGISSEELAAASVACRVWLSWREQLVRTSPSPAWQPERLAYHVEVRTSTGAELVDGAQTSNSLRWHDVDATIPDSSTASATKLVSTTIPTHVRFRGSPARRYWDLEDGGVNWSAMAAGPGDAARLITLELAVAFADHWLLVPLDVPAGSVSRIVSLVVTDTFGVSTLVRSAEDLDGPDTPWRFCGLSRPKAMAGPLLFVPAATSEPLVGPVLEEIDFSRDDVADVLWAIDRRLLGADGRGRDVTVAGVPNTVPPTPGAPALQYRIGPDVPSGQQPYRARIGAGGLELVRATVPGAPIVAARPDLPDALSIAAAPTAPTALRTFYTLRRAPDGSYHLLLQRATAAISPVPTNTLAFDRVEDRGD